MGNGRHNSLSRADLDGRIMKTLLSGCIARCKRVLEAVRRRCVSILRLLPRRYWVVERTVCDIGSIPERIPRYRAYLVAAGDLKKWLVFDCPCNSGHQLVLNLDSSRQPSWHLFMSRTSRISVWPSIDYASADRRCHFHFQQGRVVWVG